MKRDGNVSSSFSRLANFQKLFFSVFARDFVDVFVEVLFMLILQEEDVLDRSTWFLKDVLPKGVGEVGGTMTPGDNLNL